MTSLLEWEKVSICLCSFIDAWIVRIDVDKENESLDRTLTRQRVLCPKYDGPDKDTTDIH